MNQKETVLSQLKAMGFDTIELGSVGVAFKYKNLTYIYQPDDCDGNYLRISVPQLYDVTEENRVALLEAMHETTMIVKCSKVCIMYNSAWAVSEHFVTSTDGIADMLEYIILVLENTANTFLKIMKGEDVYGKLMSGSDDHLHDGIEAQMQMMLEKNTAKLN